MNWFTRFPLLLLIACGGGSGLSAEQLNAAKDSIHPLQPKAQAHQSLVDALGAPTGEDESASWWQTTGDGCKKLTVNWMGDSTGAIAIDDC